MLTIDASTVNEIRDAIKELQAYRTDAIRNQELRDLFDKLPNPDKDECPRQLPQFGGCTVTMRPYERVVLGDALDPLGFVELRSIGGSTAKIRFWFPKSVRIFQGKVADRIIAEQAAAPGGTS